MSEASDDPADLAAAEARAAEAEARASAAEATIAQLKLLIAKLRRELYGRRAERSTVLIEQLSLELEELQASASDDELRAEATATHQVRGFTRRKPARKSFPAHLPRERIVIPGPSSCPCCGSARLAKLGEDVTETLEVIPRQWKVIQTVREKFTCRCCEAISQPPAPFHVVPRGWAGPSLLAMILFEKYGQHQPLNRQSERYAREGVELSLSTLADQVGACTVVLRPLYELIRDHVLAGARVHGDDTPVPVLAKGKTIKGRVWTYVRDDRQPGPVIEAACWAHGRRRFFVLAEIGLKAGGRMPAVAPLAVEALKRIDAIFDAERALNGGSAGDRLAARRATVAPLVADLETWMRTERGKLSRHAEVAKAMDYMLRRWPAFTRFLEDGRICVSNNAAERSLRGIALGRKSWLFCGSDRGGDRAAVMYSLIGTAKLNGIDPQAWLADVLARIQDHSAQQLAELLPWHWHPQTIPAAA
jgi:transposase